jgi:hypothetical protein
MKSPMKRTLSLALALSAALPSAYAADALAPIHDAAPLYEGFKAQPLAEAQRLLSEVAGPEALAPKDFVSFIGYDEKLFSAFARLPAARTQTADFTACTEIGSLPIYNRKITKGAAAALDYAADGFTDAERDAIALNDSRVLHFVQVPTEKGTEVMGVTQYLDFLNGSTKYPATAEGINLRIGTLAAPTKPSVPITRCAKAPVAQTVFPDEILRQAATADEPVSMEDKLGVLWSVRKGNGPNKWVAGGPSHLSATAATKLFEKLVAARAQNDIQPWHTSRTETFRGTATLQRIQFAKFDYTEGHIETLTLFIADGSARLAWTISDTAGRLDVGLDVPELPPTPPTDEKTSFEDFAARYSPAGNAALHLMQVAFECPEAPVAAALSKDLISSVVLFETMGSARPTAEELENLPQAEFQKRVLAGVEQLKTIDHTDVSSTANCAITQADADTLRVKMGATAPVFQQFLKRMETISQ